MRDPVRNRINFDYLAVPENELDRNEYYAWYQPVSGMRYHLGGVVRPDLPFFASVTLHRPRRRGHATGQEMDLFRLLFDHIERALEVEYRLNLDRGIAAGLAAVAGAADGCILLDHAGRPVFVNDAARAQSGDALLLDASGVRARSGAEDKMLRGLIAACRATYLRAGVSPGGTLGLSRRERGHPLVITVTPMPIRAGELADLGPAVCILIAAPDMARAPDVGLLRQVYRLTPAEAALARQLCLGETLAQAARGRGIAVSTARTYLEQIFIKTGTRRQSDLARLLLSLARGMPAPGDPPA